MSTTRGFLMVLLVFLIACKSGPSRIADESTTIRDLAESSRKRFAEHGDSAGEAEQVEIGRRSSAIAVAAADVQDVESQMLETIEFVAIAATLIAAVVLAWQLGLGILLRRLFGWIPERERSSAKLLREAVAGTTPVTEAVAAMRASDPLFDCAYKENA